MPQASLSEATGIHRVLISKIEKQSFTPSIEQLEQLSMVLDFDLTELFTNNDAEKLPSPAEHRGRRDGICRPVNRHPLGAAQPCNRRGYRAGKSRSDQSGKIPDTG